MACSECDSKRMNASLKTEQTRRKSRQERLKSSGNIWSLWLALLLSFGCGSVGATAGKYNSTLSDFLTVRHGDLVASGGLEFFSDQGTTDFSEILFDFPRYQVIVGARDSLYRLSLEGLTRLEKAVWEADPTAVSLCTAKGQTEENCRNYIKVLAARRDQLFVCGTHAFNPKCSWRHIEQINEVNEYLDGRGKCPHSPEANSTAYMTKAGDYYIGSSTDFSSNDHAIYRMSGKGFRDLIRTVQYNARWLSQPNFVGSFETDRFIYFVFRETAVEHINCGKAIYSRIARVCKDDRGGKLVLKNNWTTFLKARLNCSLPGEYPFYYNEIQSMFYLEEEGMVYAAFSTGDNSILGSAVCSFNMTAVETAFRGPFKAQRDPDSTWEPVTDADHSHFECMKDSMSSSATEVNSREYQFTNEAVQPTALEPLFHENLASYTHIAVESVATKHQDNHPVHIIFVSLGSGIIKKLSYNTKTRETCLVEILQPFAPGKAVHLRNMKLLEATNSLYITTEDAVMRIPTQRCQRFRSRQQCVNAMDPYCGWNRQKGQCTMTPNKNPRAAYWQQEPLTCPVVTDPVDGRWGQWSPWFQCDLSNPDKRFDRASANTPSDFCQCRRRECDSPTPLNGGLNCLGNGLEVTNCTQHGRWTDWSEWSACSKSCDVGTKQRTRVCGNPAPAHGGKVCVGRDVDTQVCDSLPPCQASATTPARSVVTGRWSDWNEWSSCSAKCGKGFQSRGRTCYGLSCPGGCGEEYRECEDKKCADSMDVTDWTPWTKTNDSVGGSWYEARYKFSFKAPVTINPMGGVVKEERFCTGRNQCAVTTLGKHRDGGKIDEREDWSDWSKCTRECGTGYQIRVRDCPRGQYGCDGGLTIAERACNTQPCFGMWSCWTEWSTCDRNGKKKRSRECESSPLVSGSTGVTCQGGSSYEEMGCDGWGVWGDWSVCDEVSGYQSRFRSCVADECSGVDQETRVCGGKALLEGGRGPDIVVSAGSSAGGIVGACFIGFFLGCAVGGGLVYYFLVHKRKGGIHGSPHYVSAKSQNLYVSLPMLDLKHKHLSSSSNQSDCGTLRSTTTAGTLRSKASVNSVYGGAKGPGSDYETATIKRSHSQRNSSLINGAANMKVDLDSDVLFT